MCNDMNQIAPLETEDFSEFKNISGRIKFLKQPFERSPGQSRQKCIDEASGEYIYFCDADDALSDILAIRTIEENIKASHADLYSFPFVEEVKGKNSDLGQYLMKKINKVWVFGKVYRTAFLRENNIRFSESLHWHEDTYFNIVFNSYKPKVVNIDKILYIWKFSESSVTRLNDHEYTFNSRDEFLEALDQAFTYTKSIGRTPESLTNDSILHSIHTYLLLSNPRFENVSSVVRYRVESRLIKFMKKFIPFIFDTANYSRELSSLIASMLNGINETSFLPEKTFIQFINDLKKRFKISN